MKQFIVIIILGGFFLQDQTFNSYERPTKPQVQLGSFDPVSVLFLLKSIFFCRRRVSSKAMRWCRKTGMLAECQRS